VSWVVSLPYGIANLPGEYAHRKRIKQASTFAIARGSRRGHVKLSTLTERGPTRKFKRLRGPKCHYTLRIGAKPHTCFWTSTACSNSAGVVRSRIRMEGDSLIGAEKRP